MLMAEVVWISGSSLKMKLLYVKTLEQVRQLQNLYAEPAFESFRSLSVSFETDIKSGCSPNSSASEGPLISTFHLGTVQRYGVTYMEIRGESSEVLKGGDSGISNRFYFKYMPAPDGVGFDNDPVLVRVRHTGSTRRVERLEGDLILRESEHDPVVDVPILDIKTVMYSEGDTYTHGEILDRVPGESFLPYMFGKVDDLELLAREGVVESE